MATTTKARKNARVATDPSADARKVPPTSIDETGANIHAQDDPSPVNDAAKAKPEKLDPAKMTAAQKRTMTTHLAAIMEALEADKAAVGDAIDARLAFAVAVAKAERALPESVSFRAWCDSVKDRGFPGYDALRKARQLGKEYLDNGEKAARAMLDHWRVKSAATSAAHRGSNSTKMSIEERAALRAAEAIARPKSAKKQDAIRKAILAEIAGDDHVIVTREQASAMAASPAKASAIKDAAGLFKAWQALPSNERAAAFGLIAAGMSNVIAGAK